MLLTILFLWLGMGLITLFLERGNPILTDAWYVGTLDGSAMEYVSYALVLAIALIVLAPIFHNIDVLQWGINEANNNVIQGLFIGLIEFSDNWYGTLVQYIIREVYWLIY